MPRCPRRNKKTGKCIKKKSKKICSSNKLLDPKTNRCIKDNTKNRKKLKMKTMKICPPGKLLNPKTNRCILNNTRNRKKLNIFIYIKKKKKVSKIKINNINIFTDKCKSYNNYRGVSVVTLCNWGTCDNTTAPRILDKKMYFGKTQINIGNNKRKYLYFQIDYELQ